MPLLVSSEEVDQHDSIPISITSPDLELPQLCSAEFPSDSQSAIFRSSLNPKMDLIATIHSDSQQQSTVSTPSTSSNGPTGLSATQMAMRQRMIAIQAAKRGAILPKASQANDSSDSDAPPLRGPAIKLEIWRLTENPLRVSQSIIAPPEIWDKDQKKAGQEREEMSVDELVWSPDGQYLSIAIHLKRISQTSSSTRFSRALLIYSIRDGSQIRVIPIDPSPESSHSASTTPTSTSNPSHILSMSWLPFSNPCSSSTSSITSILSLLPPLAKVPSLEESLSGSGNKLLHHQMRAQTLQRGNVTPSTSTTMTDNFISRKKLGENGKGVLGRIPVSIYNKEISNSNTNTNSGNGVGNSKSGLIQSTKDQGNEIGNTMLIANDESGRIHLFIDGSVSIGSVDPMEGKVGKGWEMVSANFVREIGGEQKIDCFFVEEKDETNQIGRESTKGKEKETSNGIISTTFLKVGQGNLKLKIITLHLPLNSPSTPNLTIPPQPSFLPSLQSLTTLSSSITTLLSHSLDASLHLSSILHSPNSNPSLLSPLIEWNRVLVDVSIRHASTSPLHDLLHLALTGQINSVAEQMLLHTVTEAPLAGLEIGIKVALKKLLDGNRGWLIDGSQKLLAMLERLRGMSRWPQRFSSLLLSPATTNTTTSGDQTHQLQAALPPPLPLPSTLQELESYTTTLIETVQGVLISADKVERLANQDLLAHSEFYRWWRVERERQERLRSDQEDPRLLTSHDPLTVAELLRRGFGNRELEALLAPPHMRIQDSQTSPETARIGPEVPVGNPDFTTGLGDEDRSASFAFARNSAEPKSGENGNLQEEEVADDFMNWSGDGAAKTSTIHSDNKENASQAASLLSRTLQETKARLLAARNRGSNSQYLLPTPNEITKTFHPPTLFSGPSNLVNPEQERINKSEEMSSFERDHKVSRQFGELSIPQRLEAVARDVTRLLDSALRRIGNHVEIESEMEIDGFGEGGRDETGKRSDWWKNRNHRLVSKPLVAGSTSGSEKDAKGRGNSRVGIRNLFLDHKDLNARAHEDSLDLTAFVHFNSTSTSVTSSNSTIPSTLNILKRKMSAVASSDTSVELVKISMLSSTSSPLQILDFGFYHCKSSENANGVELFLLLKEEAPIQRAQTYLTSLSLSKLEFKSFTSSDDLQEQEPQVLKVNSDRTHVFDSTHVLENVLALNEGKKSAAVLRSAGKSLDYLDLDQLDKEENEDEDEEES